MASTKRHRTNYPGVFFRMVERLGGPGLERMYYIVFKREGKTVEEKIGRQYADRMTTAKAARARADRIEGRRPSRAERRAAERARDERWPLARIWATYKEERTVNKALKVDDGRFELYLKDTFGGKEPREILQLEVDRLRLAMLKTKSPATVKATLALLKRIANYGLGRGLCPGLGFKVSVPKVSNIVTEDLTADQLQALLKAIAADPDKRAGSIMLVALFTGMRRGEIYKLRWGDLDFARGFIHIRAPKGGRDETIPMNEKVRAVFESTPRIGDYVFPSDSGNQLVSVQRSLRRIRKAAGLPPTFRPLHGLRHAFASRLASSGKVDLYTLQRLLTHKSPVMTQRYAHLRDEALRRASELAGTLIDDPADSSGG